MLLSDNSFTFRYIAGSFTLSSHFIINSHFIIQSMVIYFYSYFFIFFIFFIFLFLGILCDRFCLQVRYCFILKYSSHLIIHCSFIYFAMIYLLISLFIHLFIYLFTYLSLLIMHYSSIYSFAITVINLIKLVISHIEQEKYKMKFRRKILKKNKKSRWL